MVTYSVRAIGHNGRVFATVAINPRDYPSVSAQRAAAVKLAAATLSDSRILSVTILKTR